MPHCITPNSFGSLPLVEFNKCHSSSDGKFCSTGGSLPEAAERYFHIDDETVMVPLSELQTIHYRPGNKAEQYMAGSLAGTHTKRKPITVQWTGSKYRVIDGNSTVAIARKNGWRKIPVHIVPREETRPEAP